MIAADQDSRQRQVPMMPSLLVVGTSTMKRISFPLLTLLTPVPFYDISRRVLRVLFIKAIAIEKVTESVLGATIITGNSASLRKIFVHYTIDMAHQPVSDDLCMCTSVSAKMHYAMILILLQPAGASQERSVLHPGSLASRTTHKPSSAPYPAARLISHKR